MLETIEEKHKESGKKQIDLAKICLSRMQKGISLLKDDDSVWTAFSLANKAMLMQQIHYKLPTTEFTVFGSGVTSHRMSGDNDQI